MDTIISAIRIAALAVLITTAAVCIFSEPLESHSATCWLLAFVASKTIGAAAILALIKIYPRWRRTDRHIAAFDRWCSRDIEKI